MIYDSILHLYYSGRRTSLISCSHACTIINLWQISIMLIYHNSYTYIKHSPSSCTFSTTFFWKIPVIVGIGIPISSTTSVPLSSVELVETNFGLKSLRDPPVQLNSSLIISLKLHGRHWWPNSTSSVFIPHDISAFGTVNRQITISTLSSLGITPKLALVISSRSA